MKITDKNGCIIEITDLDAAIDEAEYFKDAHHIPPAKSDKERQEYWLDAYLKLIKLKNSIDNDRKSQ